MKITHFLHTGVLPDGRVPTGGSVEVNGLIVESAPEGGCGSEGCSRSPGHWISKIHPRSEDGTVFGYMVLFNNREELEMADLDLIEIEARKLLN
ncbi:hypothetical protein [Massilia sp. BKSP1R2A-1]|uniref:hypothetical protein n=1 Tax=Massilia sp. BKSP1R2A-1 TaxID=3422595 RepID=UPI003D34B14C